ncbi:hypothetical protein [Streptomyces venezuelae]|uniref:hypothetical protein n=1 Tax=Streptomyces venezuelae TaxID=54571 RepID=UPI00342196D7
MARVRSSVRRHGRAHVRTSWGWITWQAAPLGEGVRATELAVLGPHTSPVHRWTARWTMHRAAVARHNDLAAVLAGATTLAMVWRLLPAPLVVTLPALSTLGAYGLPRLLDRLAARHVRRVPLADTTGHQLLFRLLRLHAELADCCRSLGPEAVEATDSSRQRLWDAAALLSQPCSAATKTQHTLSAYTHATAADLGRARSASANTSSHRGPRTPTGSPAPANHEEP